MEGLRRAVRYLLAVERVRARWREHNLTDARKSQLREREATERAAAESALLKLYAEVWLPAPGDGALKLDVVGLGGRPLQTTLDEKKRARIHERLTELLTTVQRKVFGSVAPGRIVELCRLGAGGDPAGKTADAPGRPGAGAHDAPGIPTDKVAAGFFSFLGFPRLRAADAVRAAIARGVETGLFAYTTGRPALGGDGRYRIDRSRIAFGRAVAEDEIDIDSGFLIAASALPRSSIRRTRRGWRAAGATPAGRAARTARAATLRACETAAVTGQVAVGRIQVRLVAVRAADSRTQIVRHDDFRTAAEELEGPHVRRRPVRQGLGPRRSAVARLRAAPDDGARAPGSPGALKSARGRADPRMPRNGLRQL